MAESKLDYIADRLDGVADKVDNLNTTLAIHVAKFEEHVEREENDRVHLIRNTDVLHENTASLKDHIRRTDLLEEYVKKLDERFAPVELEALRRRAVTDWIKGKIVLLAKLGGAIGGIGALVGIAKFLIQSLS